MAEEICGTVEWIIYSVDDGSFCVFRLEDRKTGALVTVAGNIGTPQKGTLLKLRGCWKRHPRFGMQFQAEAKEPVQPENSEEILRFLSSGCIAGIGPAMAERIVDLFGQDTLKVFENNIDALQDVPGIGKKSLEKIKESYTAVRDMQDLIMLLQSVGIPEKYAGEMGKAYGEDVMTIIETDPYRLVREIEGIGFRQVDQLAMKVGLEKEDPERILSGIRQVLRQGMQEGHVCLPQELAYEEAARLLKLESDVVAATGKEATDTQEIPSLVYKDLTYLYIPSFYEAETESAYRIGQLLRPVPRQSATLAMEQFEKKNHILLANEQREAVQEALNSALLIITGGPGTGKTTLVKAIIMAMEQEGFSVRLFAPTGRAAKRLSISSGRDADTIHKGLEAQMQGKQGTLFNKNNSNPLEEDVVIVDEASMIDMGLFYHLLSALKEGARLILVGDIDQLPPVGPGSPLRDLITFDEIPIVRLQHVFRQEEGSDIIENAVRIRKGERCLFGETGAFQIHYVGSEEEAFEKVLDFCRLEHYGDERKKLTMQVLSPMYRGTCGVDALNKALQEEIHDQRNIQGRFLVDDKVMQVRNDYEKGVYNGDIGIVWAVEGNKVFIRFPEKEVVYEGEEKNNLQIAYVTTVHKSQGSEYNTILMVLLPTQYRMLQRNLLYTGITRARKKTILITTETALSRAIAMNDLSIRYSLFLPLLRGEIRQ